MVGKDGEKRKVGGRNLERLADEPTMIGFKNISTFSRIQVCDL
jgi:hypothetical protein